MNHFVKNRPSNFLLSLSLSLYVSISLCQNFVPTEPPAPSCFFLLAAAASCSFLILCFYFVPCMREQCVVVRCCSARLAAEPSRPSANAFLTALCDLTTVAKFLERRTNLLVREKYSIPFKTYFLSLLSCFCFFLFFFFDHSVLFTVWRIRNPNAIERHRMNKRVSLARKKVKVPTNPRKKKKNQNRTSTKLSS